MKHRIVTFSLLLSLMCVFFVAGHHQPASAAGVWNITIVGAAAGGPLQVKAEGIGEALRRAVPNSNVNVPTSNPAAGLALIGLGRAEVAVGASTRMAISAKRGDQPFDKPYDFKAIAMWGADLFMFIATTKSGLNTFRDLIDRKSKIGLSVGPEGSGSFMVFSDVAKVHGTTFKEMENWGATIHYVFQAPSLSLLADGLIDGLGGLWSQPSARIINLSKHRKMVWVQLDKKAIEKMGAEFGYEPVTVSPPPDFGYGYKFANKGSVNTVRMSDIIAVRSDMTVEQAYSVTKAIFEGRDYLHNVHKSFKWLTPKNAVSLGRVLDLHEGAKKYFREVGALK